MHQYATQKLIHVMVRIGGLKESAVHHRERKYDWPPERRAESQSSLRETLPWLKELGHAMAMEKCEQLAGELVTMDIQMVIAKADDLIGMLDYELRQRKFFVIHVENLKYYNCPTLAGDEFKDKFPKANNELIEAGNCFALGRHTASVCHLMRSLEYGLKAFAGDLKITWPTGTKKTWGQIIRRIEDEKEIPAQKPIVSTPEWSKNPNFYDSCLSVLSSIKSVYRDKTFHVESSYNQTEAQEIFDISKGFLRRVAVELKEV